MSSIFFKPGGLISNAREFNGVPKDALAAANLIIDAGFGWVAQERGSNDTPATDPATDKIMRDQLHAHGVLYGGWQPASYDWHSATLIPDTLALIEAQPLDFWLFNIESVKDQSGGWQDFAPLLKAFRAAHKSMAAGVVCDEGINVKPFIAANVKVIPECFQGEQANLTPKQLVTDFKYNGYTYVFPCLQAYDGYALSNYPTKGAPGNGYSVFLVETMQGSPESPSSGDWATVKAWNGVPR